MTKIFTNSTVKVWTNVTLLLSLHQILFYFFQIFYPYREETFSFIEMAFIRLPFFLNLVWFHRLHYERHISVAIYIFTLAVWNRIWIVNCKIKQYQTDLIVCNNTEIYPWVTAKLYNLNYIVNSSTKSSYLSKEIPTKHYVDSFNFSRTF